MIESSGPNPSETCPHCRTPLPEGSECPACGPSGNGSQTSKGDSEAAFARLSAANLARMRGQWEEAIQKCVDALRHDPHNSTAHSLIGDIYQDQGRREEAIQWYQMALDLDPNNAADRTKLDRLLNPEITTSVPVRPPFWMRVGIPAALALAFLMMAVGVWALLSARQGEPNWITQPGDPPPLDLPPRLRPPQNQATAPPSRPGPSRPAPVFVPSGIETAREGKLHRAITLQMSPKEGEIRVVDVQIDPGAESAAITLLIRPREGLAAPALLRLAAEAATQAYRLDGYLQSAKVRVLVPVTGGTAPDLALVAQSMRNLASAATTPSGVFSTLWWSPALFPATPPTPAPSPAPPPPASDSSPSPPAAAGAPPEPALPSPPTVGGGDSLDRPTSGSPQ
ncbi:MAG: tetratricopeptide repeat protein [Armatimonadetes bacterium]|nr:tetratricopeptide repeat protein [Armatimonadota bacterium]